MPIPPLHTVDHEPTFVLEQDTAWDTERINYELGVLAGLRDEDPARPVTWEGTEDHPVQRYRMGLSRGDFNTVKDWLDESAGPVKFILSRLGIAEWTRVRSTLISDAPAAQILAVRLGLQRIEGHALKISDTRPLSLSDLERLRRLIGDSNLAELGSQVIAASREVLDLEKKP